MQCETQVTCDILPCVRPKKQKTKNKTKKKNRLKSIDRVELQINKKTKKKQRQSVYMKTDSHIYNV